MKLSIIIETLLIATSANANPTIAKDFAWYAPTSEPGFSQVTIMASPGVICIPQGVTGFMDNENDSFGVAAINGNWVVQFTESAQRYLRVGVTCYDTPANASLSSPNYLVSGTGAVVSANYTNGQGVCWMSGAAGPMTIGYGNGGVHVFPPIPGYDTDWMGWAEYVAGNPSSEIELTTLCLTFSGNAPTILAESRIADGSFFDSCANGLTGDCLPVCNSWQPDECNETTAGESYYCGLTGLWGCWDEQCNGGGSIVLDNDGTTWTVQSAHNGSSTAYNGGSAVCWRPN